MERSLETLWNRRAKAFWQSAAPYFRYVAENAALFILLLIAGMMWYGSFVQHVPARFPVKLAGAIALLPAVCFSPLRTWLKPADIVFLMPREGEMAGYVRRSFIYNAVPGCVAAFVVLALYWPLYSHDPGPSPWLFIAVTVIALKWANALCAWRERCMVWNASRLFARIARWATTALLLLVCLSLPAWIAALSAVLAVAVFAALLRLPSSHRFPWERLIGEEERTRKRYFAFFSLFADVPTASSRSAVPRKYLSWAAEKIAYRKDNAFVYLFALALLHTELGGIVIRLTFCGMLAAGWSGHALLFSGWAAVAAGLLFLVIIAVQLGELRHVLRHSVWRHVYPLSDDQRERSLVKVTRAALGACSVLLWLPQAATLLPEGRFVPAFAALFIYGGYALLLRPHRLMRKIKREML